jgi:hypothetical protein
MAQVHREDFYALLFFPGEIHRNNIKLKRKNCALVFESFGTTKNGYTVSLLLM